VSAPSAETKTFEVRGVRIRNLRRVVSKEHSEDGSFLFDAVRNGQWIAFGPACFGNWSVASHITRDPCFPTANLFDDDDWEDPDTVPIGWWTLNDVFAEHGTADLRKAVGAP
jgi:hypothetical protein